VQLDRRGYYRSPVTFPEHRLGKKPPNAGRKFPVETLSRDEARDLLAACGRGYAGCRDRAAYVMMYRAGLRIAEVIALLPKDVDVRGGFVTVLHGKGDRRRTIPLDPQACAVVELWLARRRELGLGNRRPLFCTISQPTPGEPVWNSVLRKTLKRDAERAGITKRVHPHGLRHTFATELAEEGVPVHVIRRLLGHNSLDTTERYIRKLYPADLARFIHARAWEPPRHPLELPRLAERLPELAAVPEPALHRLAAASGG
jgi:site-specific recombinase XerD